MPTPEQRGRPVDLPEAMRAKMENAFGADLSALKLYESRTVGELGAQAVARGPEIAFAPGLTDFSSRSGQALLGHEISHVVSQARGEVTGGGFLRDSALEARADREGAMAAAGEPVAMPAAAMSPVSAADAAGPMQARLKPKKEPKREPTVILPAYRPDGTLYTPTTDELDQEAAAQRARIAAEEANAPKKLPTSKGRALKKKDITVENGWRPPTQEDFDHSDMVVGKPGTRAYEKAFAKFRKNRDNWINDSIAQAHVQFDGEAPPQPAADTGMMQGGTDMMQGGLGMMQGGMNMMQGGGMDMMQMMWQQTMMQQTMMQAMMQQTMMDPSMMGMGMMDPSMMGMGMMQPAAAAPDQAAAPAPAAEEQALPPQLEEQVDELPDQPASPVLASIIAAQEEAATEPAEPAPQPLNATTSWLQGEKPKTKTRKRSNSFDTNL